jgi:hypothetical protein
MFNKLTDYFSGAAAKHLSAVDTISNKSNQHEIGGLVKAGFSKHLNIPVDGEKIYYDCVMIYILRDDSEPISCETKVSWYDTRYKNPERGPELRLYYKSNLVSSLMKEGDFLLVSKRNDGTIVIIITPADTSIEQQISSVFGIKNVKDQFIYNNNESQEITLPIRLLFEDLGIELEDKSTKDDSLLELLLNKFPDGFPKSKEFSILARYQIPGDPINAPDLTLMQWLEQEERLFRTYERFEVSKRLSTGFGSHGNDVDDFIGYSLSVQNRRKSRVGLAFENHLNFLFTTNGLHFQQGTSKLTTENKSKPDFLFPSFSAYHDNNFPQEKLRLLGAKTTCKDRWRQVLSEGDRVIKKHLVTIQTSISEQQLNEMISKSLQLIVPLQIQKTYSPSHLLYIKSLGEFINETKETQK